MNFFFVQSTTTTTGGGNEGATDVESIIDSLLEQMPETFNEVEIRCVWNIIIYISINLFCSFFFYIHIC